jgi:hypothetical protein
LQKIDEARFQNERIVRIKRGAGAPGALIA